MKLVLTLNFGLLVTKTKKLRDALKAGKCKMGVVRSMLLFGQQKPGLIRGIRPDTSNTEVIQREV